MKQGELAFFKAFLLDKKSHILNKSFEFKHSQRENTDQKVIEEGEVASQNLDLNLSISLHEHEQKTLFQIDKALSKIASGSFGLCDSCKCDIDSRRLKARPFAHMCLECTEDLENSKPTRR